MPKNKKHFLADAWSKPKKKDMSGYKFPLHKMLTGNYNREFGFNSACDLWEAYHNEIIKELLEALQNLVNEIDGLYPEYSKGWKIQKKAEQAIFKADGGD